MSGKDTTLDFHDSGQDDVLFEQGNMQTHTFTDFPNSAQDDDEGDKSELLKEDKKQLSFWTFEYYQQFFDVETNQVFHRVVGSMLPLPHRNFLQTHIRPSPDLYGPFWICTTLVFTTAIAGNLANYLASGGKDYQWKYDFHKVTFSATAIFCYWWLIPTAVYLVLWWRRSPAGYTFLEIICVYGYSLAIYIPISILWVVNYEWFKWTLVIIGALLSGGVLVLTFWPAVKEDTRRVAVFVIALIFICHLLLATGFVLYFLHVPARTDLTTTTVTPISVKPTEHSPKNERLAENAEAAAKKVPVETVKKSYKSNGDIMTTDQKGVETGSKQNVENKITNIDKGTEDTDKQKDNEDNSKTDVKPIPNENKNPTPNEDGLKDNAEDVRKRATKIRDRLVKKSSRNI